MTDVPRPPHMPTDTGPETIRADPNDLKRDLAELRAALENTSALLTRVATHMARLELAELTAEHRLNTQREAKIADRRWLVDHERRLRELEQSTAAE
jgi:hypothetical protein